MSTSLETNPLTQPIVDAIAAATDAHVLFFISRVHIPHCKGIYDTEREALQLAVRERFATLNLAVGYGGERRTNSVISQRIAA